jgi:hypothetical protein
MKSVVVFAVVFCVVLAFSVPTIVAAGEKQKINGGEGTFFVTSGLTIPLVRFQWIRTSIDANDSDNDEWDVKTDTIGSGIGYQLNLHFWPFTTRVKEGTKFTDKNYAWFAPSFVFLGFGGSLTDESDDSGSNAGVDQALATEIEQQYSAGLLFTFFNGFITFGAAADLLKETADRQTGFIAKFEKDTREGWQGMENISFIIGLNIPIGMSGSKGAASLNTPLAAHP